MFLGTAQTLEEDERKFVFGKGSKTKLRVESPGWWKASVVKAAGDGDHEANVWRTLNCQRESGGK
jgi:hypothetical protein